MLLSFYFKIIYVLVLGLNSAGVDAIQWSETIYSQHAQQFFFVGDGYNGMRVIKIIKSN
jgi:hypothetical protein